MSLVPVNHTGKRYGRLVALAHANPGEQPTRWRCRCDCGREVVVVIGEVLRGRRRSCGCVRAEVQPKANLRHGHAGSGNGTPEYNAWLAVRRRCLNPKHRFYRRYGGRGITICQRWLESFEHFLADMGLRPSARHSIDRMNNDGNYEPANCRWATPKQQASNQAKPRRGLDGRYRRGDGR